MILFLDLGDLSTFMSISSLQWELRNTYIGSRDSQTYGDNYGYGISITNEYLAIGSPRQIETSLLEIYPLTKFQIKNNGTLVGIAKSIKLDEPSGSTDPSYIILPVNSFAQEVGSQTQSFVFENSSHHVHIRTDASLQNTPLTVSDKIKITPEGIIATFKDIHDGTSPIENNINILDKGKIRYEQDPLQFAEDTGSQKTINLYSSKNLFFSGKLDYDNNGIDGEPIPDYEITDRGSGFDGVSSPVLSLQFERLNDPNNSNNYDPPIDRDADSGLEHVGITTPSMFLGKIQSVEIIDGGQDYTTDSIVEFKRNVDVIVKEGSLFLSLPDGHYVKEPYATEIQGEYIAEPSSSDPAVTLESLGITDYTLPNADIKFVNANGYYMSGGGSNWYLRHPDTGKAILRFSTDATNPEPFTTDNFKYNIGGAEYLTQSTSQNVNAVIFSTVEYESLIINTGGVIPIIDGRYTVTNNPNDIKLEAIRSPEESGEDLQLLHEDENLRLESANSATWRIVDIASNRAIVTSTFNNGIDAGTGTYNDSNYNDIFRQWKADGHGYSNPFHDESKNQALNNIVILEPPTFTFEVNSVRDGIITGVSINDGVKIL